MPAIGSRIDTASPGRLWNGSFFRVSVLYTCKAISGSKSMATKRHEKTQKGGQAKS